MTRRAAAIQGGLAALSLVAAHFTWQREPERAPGDVTVLDASKSDLTRVHYEDDNTAVDFTRKGSDGQVFMHVVDKRPAVKPATDKTDKPVKPPPPPAPPRDLLGSENASHLYDKFAPLVSPRAFGVLEAAKLKELGLEKPTHRVLIDVKGNSRQFDIGLPANSTTGESFLRDARDGRVYLMPRGMLNELQNAPHLVERKLHTFEMADYDSIVVTAGGKRKEFLHVGKDAFVTEGFAPPSNKDKRDQMVKNWHDGLFRTFPVEMLGKGEVPLEGEPKIAVRVEYFYRGKSIGWLEVAKAEPAKAALSEDAAAPASQPGYYVRSERTLGWAKVHNVQQAISDAEKITSAP